MSEERTSEYHQITEVAAKFKLHRDRHTCTIDLDGLSELCGIDKIALTRRGFIFNERVDEYLKKFGYSERKQVFTSGKRIHLEPACWVINFYAYEGVIVAMKSSHFFSLLGYESIRKFWQNLYSQV